MKKNVTLQMELARSLKTLATVLKRPGIIAVAVAVGLVSVRGGRETAVADSKEVASTKTVTWKDYHPEVAEVFSKEFINWPCEKIDTGLRRVHQPCITLGAGQELFVAGNGGEVFHSTDLGKTWALLCKSPDFSPQAPNGTKRRWRSSCGIGVTDKGTLLVVWEVCYSDGKNYSYKNETVHRFAWVTRSEDRGKTWEAATAFDPAPYQLAADQATILQLRDGRLMVPIRVQAWSRPGKPISLSEDILRSFVYTSSNDGKTWSNYSKFTDHSPEPDLCELPSGRILASIRYQRRKIPGDPPELATPFRRAPNTWPKECTSATDIGQTIFQNTALTSSEDGGKTWATPRLITGTSQQSGSLLTLSNGTIVLTFGRWGQKFMLSYDAGKTWSKRAYRLNGTGEYARSIVLEGETIVTVHDGVGQGERGNLCVLRWKVPPREEVEKHGFFTPTEIKTDLRSR